MTHDTRRDITDSMVAWAQRRAEDLAAMNISGYVFKARSATAASAAVWTAIPPRALLIAIYGCPSIAAVTGRSARQSRDQPEHDHPCYRLAKSRPVGQFVGITCHANARDADHRSRRG